MKIDLRNILFLALIFLLGLNQVALAQESQENELITCKGNFHDENISMPTDENDKLRPQAATSDFIVTYIDFPEEAKAPFEAAIKKWESLMVSKQPIRVKASWASLSNTSLASSGSARVYKNFKNAKYTEVWYPGPIAESISNSDLNNGDYDIIVNLNKNISWSYLTSGVAVTKKFDLMTIVLHEIAHGLGFTTTFGVSEDQTMGKYGQSGLPYIYDLYVQNSSGSKLLDINKFLNPSIELKSQITSGSLFFKPTSTSYIKDLIKLYTPKSFTVGGSVSHFDEDYYPPGNINSLMSPTVATAEVNHLVSNMMLSVLNDMGWSVTFNSTEKASVAVAPLILSNQIEFETDVKIFPNPSADFVSVYFPVDLTNQEAKIQLFNQNGVLLEESEITISEFPFSFDLKNRIPGVYFIKAIQNNKTSTHRILHH